MPIHMTIICDTPESERAPVWQDESIRCYSDFHKNIHTMVYGNPVEISQATADIRKLALFQGWRLSGARLICPACVRHLQR